MFRDGRYYPCAPTQLLRQHTGSSEHNKFRIFTISTGFPRSIQQISVDYDYFGTFTSTFFWTEIHENFSDIEIITILVF